MKCRIWHSIKHLDSFKSPFVTFSFFLSVFLYFLTAPPWGWGGGYLHCIFALAELCWHCFLLNRTTGRGRWRPWRSGWRRWSSHCTTSNCCLKRRSLSWRNRWVHSDNWTIHCIHWMWMIAKAKRHWGRRTATVWNSEREWPPPLPRTLPAAQERQSGRADQRPVRGERSAAEGSGDHRAAAEDRREEKLPSGWEDLQPEQDCARPQPLVALAAAFPLQMLTVKRRCQRSGQEAVQPFLNPSWKKSCKRTQKKRAFFSATVVCLIVLCKLWVFFFLFFLSVLRMMKHQMEGHSNL